MKREDNKEDIFSCIRCGFCCHGETTVSLSSSDQKRMAEELGLSLEKAKQQYWRVTGNIVQMKVIDGHCIFYDKTLPGCRVHNGRPERCRQWPLHPSMLADKNNYLTITESCPGFNTRLSYDEFCRLLRQHLTLR
ncbi:MAG: Fe-S oxidoreductase [Desulfobulbus propionicus]|nr:MAG: Fe-S oxidoreductase [Desulfobulbus propionicus]